LPAQLQLNFWEAQRSIITLDVVTRRTVLPALRTACCLTPHKELLISAKCSIVWDLTTKKSLLSVVHTLLVVATWSVQVTMDLGLEIRSNLTTRFFKNLIFMEWRPRKWEGPLQFEDVDTGDLMMLPTDMALKTDPQFRVFAELYAKDEPKFFNDFSFAFAKLLALGVPPALVVKESDRDKASAEFREAAMHGSLPTCQKLAPRADVHAVEKSSQRSALHKAAFWGHDGTVRFLINECKLNIDAQDFNGDTALHDAVRFDHPVVVQFLLDSKADPTIKNKHGLDVVAVAQQYGHTKLIQMLQNHSKSKL